MKKRKRQQVIVVDLATCTLIEKVWWDVISVHCSQLITQSHVSRLEWSLSLFVETSYNSRLGDVCTD